MRFPAPAYSCAHHKPMDHYAISVTTGDTSRGAFDAQTQCATHFGPVPLITPRNQVNHQLCDGICSQPRARRATLQHHAQRLDQMLTLPHSQHMSASLHQLRRLAVVTAVVPYAHHMNTAMHTHRCIPSAKTSQQVLASGQPPVPKLAVYCTYT